jgi:pimeloyl-ACP methyl ester carboxylesterase
MKYANIQNRELTSNSEQYSFFRNENKDILRYLRKFPKLPESYDVRFLEKWDLNKCKLLKISYLVEPLLSVCSYLLLPKTLNDKKRPGILALHQHNDEYQAGKSEVIGLVKNPQYTKLEAVLPNKSHQTPNSRNQFAYGRELCERGFIVLAPDFIGFEDYREKDDYYQDRRFLRGYEEMLSAKYLNYGSCLMAKHIHDMYVALSVLSSIKGANSSKLGVIGHSLGGEVATLLSAFDSRVKAGVSSCATISYEDIETRNRMETAETIIPNFRANGLDFDFFLDMIPPTPFLATNGQEDATVQGQILLERNRRNFEVISFLGKHSFPQEVREAAYGFFRKVLY